MPLKNIINVHAGLSRLVDVEEQIKSWEECGIEKSFVCVSGIEQDGEMYTNEKLIPIMRKYPDMIIGIGRIDMGWYPTGPERVELLKEHGFVGLYCTRPSYPYDNEIYYPLYDCALDLDMPLLFETGILPPEQGDRTRGISSEKMRALRLDGVVRAFPELRIMVSGMGYPLFEEGLALINTFDDIWGELQGITDSDEKRTAFRRFIQPPKGISESDFSMKVMQPLIQKLSFASSGQDCAQAIEWYEKILDEFSIDEEIRELFWRGNAEKWLEPREDYELEEEEVP